MIKAKYQKMYTEKHKQDMDFVIISDCYIGPFIDMDVAQKAVNTINSQFAAQPKPRTRTEYEKVTESIFDLRENLERGGLYERVVSQIRSVSITEGSGVIYEYEQIKSELDLFKLAVNGDEIYRRVEKVVDDRQEFVDAACELVDVECKDFNKNIDCSMAMKSVIVAMGKSGKFKLVRANGEIE